MKWASVLSGCFLSASAMSENGDRLMAMKLKQWATRRAAIVEPTIIPSQFDNPVECTDGQVIVDGVFFDCDKIDFEGFVSLNDMVVNENTRAGSDIWGWEDGNGREIVIMCVNNGVWFVDATAPASPKVIGSMASTSSVDGENLGSSWCDVKVYKDTAYVVKDRQDPDNGMQVFDLNRLNTFAGVDAGDTDNYEVFEEDFLYTLLGDSHNILIDNESGFLYSVGGDLGGDGCNEGLHMINLEPNPLRPTFAGCVGTDGYTHDAQCVVYDGPDSRYTGKELCFAYNQDTLTIWDVTDKENVVAVSVKPYENFAYTHQGWLTQDMKYLLLDDELDESDDELNKRTRTFLVNVEDLEKPVFEKMILHDTNSIDHNLYFWGAIHEKNWAGGNNNESPAILPQYAYLSNYASGIRVIELNNDEYVPRLAGFFDMSPEFNTAEFHGTWSNYMFTSGTLAVSSIEHGLFLLKPNMAFEEVEAVDMQAVNVIDLPVRGDEGEDGDDSSDGADVGFIILIIFLVIAILGIFYITNLVTKEAKKLKEETPKTTVVHYDVDQEAAQE